MPRRIASWDHRAWPPPSRRWWMAMTWYDLAFLHWPVPAEALRAHLPPGLELDARNGTAWLGLVPFGMSGVRPKFLPVLPWIGKFLEFNVRTYVTCGGKPGVWFFSLDAANRLAVRVARRSWLPYFDARMSLCHEPDGWIHYRSVRTHRGAPPAEFQARYRPSGPVFTASIGSLEHWLTERYCLYAADREGNLYRGEIHHGPWPLQPAEVELAVTTASDDLGLPLSGPPPHVHFSRRLDVVAWSLERVMPATDRT